MQVTNFEKTLPNFCDWSVLKNFEGKIFAAKGQTRKNKIPRKILWEKFLSLRIDHLCLPTHSHASIPNASNIASTINFQKSIHVLLSQSSLLN